MRLLHIVILVMSQKSGQSIESFLVDFPKGTLLTLNN